MTPLEKDHGWCRGQRFSEKMDACRSKKELVRDLEKLGRKLE